MLQQGPVRKKVVDFDRQRVLVLADLNGAPRSRLLFLGCLFDEDGEFDTGLVGVSELMFDHGLRLGYAVLVVLDVCAGESKRWRLQCFVGGVVLL